MELIDRVEFMSDLSCRITAPCEPDQWNGEYRRKCYSFNDICEMLKSAPTIDAEPVVHAHWIERITYERGKSDYVCSACNYEKNFYQVLLPFVNYCPHCGAKMDEEAEQG